MIRLLINLFAVLLGVFLYNYTGDVIWSLIIGAPIVIAVTILTIDNKDVRNNGLL